MIFLKRKVPYVESLQLTECGLSCVCMILRYYKSYETLQELRSYLDIGRDGSTLKQLNGLLQKLNFDTKLYKSPAEGLSQIKLPAILFWENSHFVILEKINSRYAYVVDPAYGRRKFELDEFKALYSEYALAGHPNEEFVPCKKEKSIWFYFLPVIFQKKLLFLMISLLSVFTYLLTLGMPIFIQKLIDNVITKKDVGYIKNSLIFLGVFSLIYIAINFIKNKNLIRLKLHIDESVSTGVFYHLLKVPFKFFDIRNKYDILYTLNSSFIIRETFANQMINGIIDCGAVLFIIFYMANQSIVLTFVSVILFLVNLILIAISQPYVAEYSKYLITEQGKVQGVQIESVFSILGIKMSAIENDVFKTWNSKYQTYLNKYSYKEKVNNYIDILMSFIKVISPLIILSTSVYLTIKSQITIGQTIAFYSLCNTFFSLSNSVFNIWFSFINSSLYLERLGDIITTEKENISEDLIKAQIDGNIRLDNVSFSYSKHSSQVIKNVSIEIPSGNKVAIVGKSGSGKSTLAKLLVGLYAPTEGDVFYNNIHIDKLDKGYLRSQMGIVPQDISLFNKSIYDNIAMDRGEITLEKVERACQIAQIAYDISSMPMGYNTLVSEMGMNLSGGQRQRIALARAILNEPKILVLDEATSSLDYLNEKLVSDYFKSIGCTRIIIAHRLSTIVDSDIIFVLKDGKVVEQGTHYELLRKGGEYSVLYQANNNDIS
ncbi:MAG TPA: peptidase domain-containing ABC transporter [Pseudobacteroides sp.]|uniref:peptidase domain-containing ABC transporter n=1 Tax=Pseudobacteroides sp. TaxID=1968840 RepID=UPI002F91ECDA